MIEQFRQTNDYNTPLNDRYYEGLNKEIVEEINSAIDEIVFIQRLISPNIPSVSDLEKDDLGRIIVDITNPHRLENMRFFTQAADNYRKSGKYTDFPANRHPKSSYAVFWREEKRRIREGLVREDGEWIPGSLYWYWNYCPIAKTVRLGKGKRSERVQDFGNIFLGDYLFWHYIEQAKDRGEHAELLKVRGIGNSFKMASIGPRNALFKEKSHTFYVAHDMQYLTKDGVITKAWDYLDFLAEHTPFPRLRTKNSNLEKRIGYIDTRTGTERGMKSDIMGISTKDDPDKIRGKRGDIIFEEYGSYPHIKKAWQLSRASVEDGENVFAQLIAGGTGGTEGSDFEGAEDMFYAPKSYNIMPLKNVYDRNTNGQGECGFFWGAYLNRANCYDENGMPDVTKALKELFVELFRIKKSSSDPRTITHRKAEFPITPQDSMMKFEGTLFPVADIREYLEKVMPRLDEFVGPHYIGDLVFNPSGQVEWRLNGFAKPIREFPLKDNKYEGCIEIFEKPFLVNGEAQRGRYIAGIDPYDDDESTTVSLGSILILDLFTDRIVAEYTGRPKFANDFYEMCRRLLLYYNAVANYENDKKGLFQYFDRKNSLYLLSDTLQSLKDVEMIRGNMYGNKSKGTNSGKFINARARRLFADWMLTPAYGIQEDGSNILNLHKIRSIALLLEAMKWSIDGNFDRVSAAGMLMLLREDRQKYIENAMNRDKGITVGLQFDKYFVRNSKGTLNIKNYFEDA
jgi:hypothetical protein